MGNYVVVQKGNFARLWKIPAELARFCRHGEVQGVSKPEPLSSGQVARLFGVKARTIQRWDENGWFEQYGIYPWKTPGGELRFDEQEVLQAIEAQKAKRRIDLRKELQSMTHLDKVYVLSVANMKGGVGKTTIAVNLAYALAKRYGWRVLLVDVDPQGNTTSHLRFSNLAHKVTEGFIPFERNISQLWRFNGDKPMSEVRVQTGLPSGGDSGDLDLVPTDHRSLEVEHAISALVLEWARDGRLPTPEAFQSVVQDFYMTLTHRLDELLAVEPYDLVVMDTPPTLGPLTTAALLASDGYLVPVEPEEFSRNGVEDFESLVSELAEKLDHKVGPLGYVINQSRRSTNRRSRHVEDLERELGEKKLGTIREDSTFSNAQSDGVPIYEYVDDSGRQVGRSSRGAEEIWELAAVVKERIEAALRQAASARVS